LRKRRNLYSAPITLVYVRHDFEEMTCLIENELNLVVEPETGD
jgi:hypothetical protein